MATVNVDLLRVLELIRSDFILFSIRSEGRIGEHFKTAKLRREFEERIKSGRFQEQLKALLLNARKHGLNGRDHGSIFAAPTSPPSGPTPLARADEDRLQKAITDLNIWIEDTLAGVPITSSAGSQPNGSPKSPPDAHPSDLAQIAARLHAADELDRPAKLIVAMLKAGAINEVKGWDNARMIEAVDKGLHAGTFSEVVLQPVKDEKLIYRKNHRDKATLTDLGAKVAQHIDRTRK